MTPTRLLTCLVLLVLGAGCRANLPAPPTAPVALPGSVANPMSVYDPRWTTTPEQLATPAGSRVAVRDRVGPSWSGSAGLGVFSQYVWRGALLVDDPVLQPDVTVAYGGLSLNVWGNIDLTDVNGFEGELNEVNITLDYTHTFDGRVPVDVSVGGIWYTSPAGWFDDLAEVYAGVGLDVFLKPRLTVYFGVYEVEGIFGTLEFGHECRLGCGTLELGTGISAGDSVFHEALFSVSDDSLGEFFFDVGWTYTRGRWSVRPGVRFSTLVDGTLRDAQDDNDFVVFSLQASVDF